MVSVNIKIGIASIITFLLYVTYCVLTALGLYGTTKLYPQTMEESVNKYDMLLFPTFKTFSCLVVVYVLQFIWLVYSLSCMCRNGDGSHMFSIKFFASFSVSLCFYVGAAFAWWREEVVATFILLIFQVIFMKLAFGLSCYDLNDYLKTNDIKEDNKCDVWCQRFLVQNGLQFGVVVNILVFVGIVSVFLHFELGASDFSVSLGMLIMLGVAIIIWFSIESFPLRSFTDYTFTSYIAFIYYFSGLVANIWGKDKTIAGFAVFFLVASCLLFVTRIFLIIYRSSKRGSYENITYTVKTDTVNA